MCDRLYMNNYKDTTSKILVLQKCTFLKVSHATVFWFSQSVIESMEISCLHMFIHGSLLGKGWIALEVGVELLP